MRNQSHVKGHVIRNALITIYILIVLGISATARANMTIYPIFTGEQSVQMQNYLGDVVMTPNRDFFLIVSENEVYQLAANIDLFDYNGQKVEIKAVELKHSTGPVNDSSTLDPLPGNGNRPVAAPVLVVFGISGVAQ